jgi:phosphoglycolate phosphatase-like HAD superfamily hydrolase
LLAVYALQHCFQWVLGAETAGDKAEKLAALAAQPGVARERVTMVGDGVSDVRAAKAAGVRSVAVTWGYHSRARLEREAPDHIVETPFELVRTFAG